MILWIKRILPVLLAIVLLYGCTSSRWIVESQRAVDTTKSNILNSREVVLADSNITPDHPILKLSLVDINKVRYPQRLVVKRYIQQYRPRYGFMALGLIGTGFLVYTTHFSGLKTSKRNRTILDGAAGLLALSSILNMKPVGKPKPTGESRFSKQTGSVTRIDTTLKSNTKDETALLKILYRKNVLLNNIPLQFKNGLINLDLARNIDIGTVDDPNPGSLNILVSYDNQSYTFQVPVKHFTRRFALVIRPKASLYSSPKENDANIITDVGYHTQLQLVNKEGDWYKVLYGLTPTYLRISDADLVWKPSSNIVAPNVVVIPHTKFGDIDVEKNIPVDSVRNPNAVAVLMNNTFSASDSSSKQDIYNRDIELMKDYMNHTLGINENHIFVFNHTDMDSARKFWGLSSNISEISSFLKQDTTDLYIYYVGNSSPSDNDSTAFSGLVPALQGIINRTSRLNNNKSLILIDANFNQPDFDKKTDSEDKNGRLIQKLLFQSAQSAVSNRTNMSIIFSSDQGQTSGIYQSKENNVDKRHSIFTYYLCNALKEGDRNILDIYHYLQRNVTFTSRSLFDRPQDPVIFGNLNMNISN